MKYSINVFDIYLNWSNLRRYQLPPPPPPPPKKKIAFLSFDNLICTIICINAYHVMVISPRFMYSIPIFQNYLTYHLQGVEWCLFSLTLFQIALCRKAIFRGQNMKPISSSTGKICLKNEHVQSFLLKIRQLHFSCLLLLNQKRFCTTHELRTQFWCGHGVYRTNIRHDICPGPIKQP